MRPTKQTWFAVPIVAPFARAHVPLHADSCSSPDHCSRNLPRACCRRCGMAHRSCDAPYRPQPCEQRRGSRRERASAGGRGHARRTAGQQRHGQGDCSYRSARPRNRCGRMYDTASHVALIGRSALMLEWQSCHARRSGQCTISSSSGFCPKSSRNATKALCD